MKKDMKLQIKITLLTSAIVLVSILVIIPFIISWISSNIEIKSRTNIMNIAEIIAHSEEVVKGVEKNHPTKEISDYIDMQLKHLSDVEYIIVADEKGIRYSHPHHELIGEKFVGGDELRAINQGEEYISEAMGTLGKSLRAFTPIYDNNKKVIGFVCVGTLTHSIDKAKKTAYLYIFIVGFFSTLVGIIGAFLLAKNIRKSLFGLEPPEIAKLYNEKIAILDAIREGLVAVDDECKITLINDSALSILNLNINSKKEDFIGKNLEEFIPNTEIFSVLESGVPEFDKEHKINNTIILTNRIPIFTNNKIAGAIASFRDKTEITKMAEELTGVKKLAWSLRAQNHEFMNKLHTISGLIQLEEYESALKFITDVSTSKNKLSNILTENIKDSSIAGILLSKYNKADEYNIKFIIDENSNLEKLPHIISQSVVSVIGNLIENSIDEVEYDGTGYIHIKINSNKNELFIKISNNGKTIPLELRDKIFEQGFSTKNGQRGHGLYIVKKIIEDFKGTIEIFCDKNVNWIVKIPIYCEGTDSIDSSNDS